MSPTTSQLTLHGANADEGGPLVSPEPSVAGGGSALSPARAADPLPLAGLDGAEPMDADGCRDDEAVSPETARARAAAGDGAGAAGDASPGGEGMHDESEPGDEGAGASPMRHDGAIRRPIKRARNEPLRGPGLVLLTVRTWLVDKK